MRFLASIAIVLTLFPEAHKSRVSHKPPQSTQTSTTSTPQLKLCHRRRIVKSCLELGTVQLQAQLFRMKTPPPPRFINTNSQIDLRKP